MDFTYFHEEHEIIERFLMTTIFCHCEMIDTPKPVVWSVLGEPQRRWCV
jgi:hypothetical protein